MNLRDTFARGFVWKLAGLLALAAFGWFAGIGEAKAQTNPYQYCNAEYPYSGLCHTRQDAYDMARANAMYRCNQSSAGCVGIEGSVLSVAPQNGTQGGYYFAYRYNITPTVTGVANGSVRNYAVQCVTGQWNDETKKCAVPCDANAPPKGETWVMGYADGGAGNICEDGCGWGGDMENEIDRTKVDGIVYTKYSSMEPTGNSCTANDPNVGQGEDPPADGDGDGSSDGQDTSPGNPGQGAGGSDDPGGESDDPGEGSGNGNKSTGGGNCATPPNSHGDQIAAQTAYQTWATRCAIEKAQEKDGTLKTKQATGTGTGTGGGTSGLGDCDDSLVGGAICAVKEFFAGLTAEAGTLDGSEGEGDEPGSVWSEEEEEIDLDTSGLGWGGGCPQLPAITVGGYSGQIDGGKLCEILSALGALILLLAYFQAAIIIGR